VNVLNSRKIDSSYWRALFAADSIAVIGAKDVPGSWGFDALRAASDSKRPGRKKRVYAVNPGCKEVLGYSCYKTILDITEPVELAIIVVPAPVVPQVLRQCAEKKARMAVIVSAGFGEVDEAGARLENELLEIAGESGMHFVGPNCVGHADIHTPLASAGMAGGRLAGPMSIISQSGTLGANMMQMAANYGIGLSKFISTGNETDIRFEDYLEYLATDRNTGIIAAYIEGLREGRRFYEIAKKITFKKPMIVIKTGSTEESGKAAKSHTGALSGADEIYSAAFKQAGVIRVDDVEEFTDTLRAFYKLAPMKGRRVGVISYTGGFAVMGIEACQKYGLEVAKFSPQTISVLDGILPSWQGVGNPADLGPGIMVRKLPQFETLETVAEAILDDPGVDAVLGIFGAFGPSVGAAYYQIAEKAAMSHPHKPFVFYFYGPFVPEALGEFQAKDDMMAFPSPNRAVRALGHLADYSEFRMKS